MPEKSSVERASWPIRLRLLMLALNCIPLLHVTLVVWAALAWAWFWIPLCLYLLPPVIVRTLMAVRPPAAGSHPAASREFIFWWATAQAQMIFCRLPILEEILRLVPGCYSLWLRVWGAKIGRLTFWAPGMRILDRSFLRVGDDVIFGAGVRLSAHVFASDQSGHTVLHLAPIVIGDRSHIGGYALLAAGSVVEADSDVHACALLPPFTHWKDGRRTKLAVTP